MAGRKLRWSVFQMLICITAVGACLYSYIDMQNAVTRLRLEIPKTLKEIRNVKEENARLQYAIDRFESPEHLIELARTQSFVHLKHPMLKEIIAIQEGAALQVFSEEKEHLATASTHVLPGLHLNH